MGPDRRDNVGWFPPTQEGKQQDFCCVAINIGKGNILMLQAMSMACSMNISLTYLIVFSQTNLVLFFSIISFTLIQFDNMFQRPCTSHPWDFQGICFFDLTNNVDRAF